MTWLFSLWAIQVKSRYNFTGFLLGSKCHAIYLSSTKNGYLQLCIASKTKQKSILISFLQNLWNHSFILWSSHCKLSKKGILRDQLFFWKNLHPIACAPNVSVNFKMSFWCQNFFQKTNEIFCFGTKRTFWS